MKKVIVAVGARPNFVKMAPIVKKLSEHKIWYIIVNTGQHYDDNLSKIFFNQLEVLEAEVNLNVGSGSHGSQTAKIISGFEKICKKEEPDIVITIGDTNSSLGCSLAASKCGFTKVVHVESGERCYDENMPEEINRRLIDHMSDCLLCTNEDSKDNLLKEGISPNKIFVVGNPIIDAIVENWNKLSQIKVPMAPYCILTVHREENTNSRSNLTNILMAAQELSSAINVIFPIHPRTMKQIKKFGLDNYLKYLSVFQPMGYIEFLSFLRSARFVLTDSGGLQVESAFLGVPCITMRESTEWKFTIANGVNCLVGCDITKILTSAFKFLNNKKRERLEYPFLDGNTSERIVKVLKERYDV